MHTLLRGERGGTGDVFFQKAEENVTKKRSEQDASSRFAHSFRTFFSRFGRFQNCRWFTVFVDCFDRFLYQFRKYFTASVLRGSITMAFVQQHISILELLTEKTIQMIHYYIFLFLTS